MAKIAIHGFGRIGRSLMKVALKDNLFTPVSISDIKDVPTLAALFEVDTNYGRWHEEVKATDKGFVIGGREIPFFDSMKALPDWKALGVDLVINYKETPDFSEAVKNFTGKKGVDVILDHIGAKYLEPNMNSLAYAGRLVLIGVTSGIKAELNLALMMVKRQRIIGSVLRSRPVSEKGEIVAEFTRRALPKFADRTIIPLIEKVFPLEEVQAAHRMMEEDRHFGKIVLRVGG